MESLLTFCDMQYAYMAAEILLSCCVVRGLHVMSQALLQVLA